MSPLLSRVLHLAGRAVAYFQDDSPAREQVRSQNRRKSTKKAGAPLVPAQGEGTCVYDVASLGLPAFTYRPDPNGEADPGEVVWTWVPYEEDPNQGKDRPVLVLARTGKRLVVAQMTSKDHDLDAAQEARWGRYWHDVGSGAWDKQGRPSEVRLDRLLSVRPQAVRREGATLDRATFDGVVAALRSHWS
ncbi:type II toxin-antitoxin system PemK/MazF family toxin [Actinomyces sp. MRS3W]|uniref:type II toxin-antitoxin system PemK/MazF family toxin n=1 Tax=Actinomyces sp. MRS3W TaxID=2800796 RepID=UPI0028FD1F69|nr:type II toxin-antitoxin system PemK/MazF family toxin [Actinomyces sp. MRS3W]MDU0349080.1 type II toxin-antitoxin system PemK/MazF family toxin [Actinomyces sp. MRS3W]